MLVALVIKGLIIYGNKNVTKNSTVICDGYVKYEEAEVDISAIMRISEIMRKTIKNGRLAAILDFVLYSWSSYFAFFLGKYHKITQIQNGR